MSSIRKKLSPDAKKQKLIDKLAIYPGTPVELAVMSIKTNRIDCKHIPTLIPVSMKWELYVQYEVEGEIITVMPEKVWQYKGVVRLTGKIISRRLQIEALCLTPLKLEERRIFDPDEEEDLIEEGDDPFNKYYIPIMAYGHRKVYELEKSITIENSEKHIVGDPFSKAISEGADRDAAFQILREILERDFRCILAHAYLGNLEFNVSNQLYPCLKNKAMRHYQAGMKIAELSLGPVFHDLLPWGYINNRAYLRCLYGYGLSLWRNGNSEAAMEILEKMLWLNPWDEQGARFHLDYIGKGKKWDEERLFGSVLE